MSSLGGSCNLGNRSRNRRTVSIVSSTESVVWDSQTTFSGSRTVTLVTDQQDVVVGGSEPLGLLVHLGDERAGRVDRLELPRGRLLVHHRGDAVRGEDDRLALGHLVGLV